VCPKTDDDKPRGARPPPPSTLSPTSDRWLPYYAASEREATERAASRVRQARTADVATKLLFLCAMTVIGALYWVLR
jgi:hypothetical protein